MSPNQLEPLSIDVCIAPLFMISLVFKLLVQGELFLRLKRWPGFRRRFDGWSLSTPTASNGQTSATQYVPTCRKYHLHFQQVTLNSEERCSRVHNRSCLTCSVGSSLNRAVEAAGPPELWNRFCSSRNQAWAHFQRFGRGQDTDIQEAS